MKCDNLYCFMELRITKYCSFILVATTKCHKEKTISILLISDFKQSWQYCTYNVHINQYLLLLMH